MAKRSFAERAIKNFYDNRDAIALQRAQELVTELYLAEGKKRLTVWKNLITHLEKLGVQKIRIDQLIKKDDPKMVAELVTELMNKQG